MAPPVFKTGLAANIVAGGFDSLPPPPQIGASARVARRDSKGEISMSTARPAKGSPRKRLKASMPRKRPRLTSLAPQFLIDDLERAIAFYRDVLGFEFGEPVFGFYAIGRRDGLELHLKEAPKNRAERKHRRKNQHLDAYAGVEGIDAFYEQCVSNGANILKPLAPTAWGTRDFYIEDPEGYILGFGCVTND